MDCKEEISDSDSGIILNSGPDSPTSPVKDLSTYTRAMRLKQQALEDRLELCVLELKKLCTREAELTGKLPSDYPLLPDEKPPQIRRRIGTAFKLDEGFISHDGEESELHALETDLALQRQIYEAARKLSLEEHISKALRKSRLQQYMCMSDDSSLSDAVALDDDSDSTPLSPAILWSSTDCGFQRLKLLNNNGPKQSSFSSSLDYEPSPIQNAPWKESSLDQPYQKQKASISACSSRSSSPTSSPTDTRLAELPPPPQFVFKSLPLRNNQPKSAPSTPELPLRRQFSQSFRLPRNKLELTNSDMGRGRTKLPRRRVTDFALAYSVQRLYQCSSEDSSSELSISSFSSSSSREMTTEAPKTCPPPYGYHRTTPSQPQSQLSAQRPPKNNNNNLLHHVTSPNRVKVTNGASLEADMGRLQLGPNSQLGNACNRKPTNKPQPVEVTSPKQMLKPPPPYIKVVRTTSLREYPNHASRALPRDVLLGELKTWHQKNNVGVFRPCSLERQGSIRMKRPEPPPYNQIPSHNPAPQKVILQRASDGTPLQWYEGEDAEIVSQV
ncbi:innate immunity activator protein-like isoform X2 [Xyrauchen texanus]|uniref:innate immunity activator protein-like isoform X2 n=1 Tax=Xyrauchen texanus TaxID=154827 RepID=UPI0022425141|nr:innate immunity activator protein-like isoform X2 [Xyrauchen texanus]